MTAEAPLDADLSTEALAALDAGLRSAREAIRNGQPFQDLGSFLEYADDDAADPAILAENKP